MNTPEDVQSAVSSGRNLRLEWAAAGAAQPDLADLLTGMANAKGGTLLIGLNEQGEPGGLHEPTDAERAIDRVLAAALALDPPLILPLPRTIALERASVVVVTVPPGMPHIYAHHGRYLLREGEGNVPLRPRELRRLMLERGELSFEAEIAQGATQHDIDWEKVGRYVAVMRDLLPGSFGELAPARVLLHRGCLVSREGKLRPTNAGILLFGKNPQMFVRSAELTAVRFSGDSMTDTHIRQDITGTLPEQLDRAGAFLIDHLRKGVQMGRGMARTEYPEYPMEAARELVVNAIAHRDYSIDGDCTRLSIFSDRLEVTSPGGLPGPITLENMKDERFSRNPIIVQVLADMRYIERLGYGIDRVIALMQQQQLQPPQWNEMAGGLRVSLYNRSTAASEADDAEPDVRHFRDTAVNVRQEAALKYLQDGHTRITNSDLQMLCPDVHAETIRRDLADLVAKNILRKMGEKRGSYYVMRDAAEETAPTV
jgi:ATP-dependent DNA helicase RecG